MIISYSIWVDQWVRDWWFPQIQRNIPRTRSSDRLIYKNDERSRNRSWTKKFIGGHVLRQWKQQKPWFIPCWKPTKSHYSQWIIKNKAWNILEDVPILPWWACWYNETIRWWCWQWCSDWILGMACAASLVYLIVAYRCARTSHCIAMSNNLLYPMMSPLFRSWFFHCGVSQVNPYFLMVQFPIFDS